MTTKLRRLIAAERRRQRGRLLLAGCSAAVVAAASVLLLGLSGWFITGAALAGMASTTAFAFNTLLPSAGIRLLAILRTACRYTERLSGHDAAFRALARIRPELYAALAATPPESALSLAAGDAVARMVQDVDEVEQRFVRLSSSWAAVAACLAGATLLLLAGAAAAVAVVAVAAGVLVIARRLSATAEAQGRAVPPANGALRQDFAALAAAAPELRAYGLEDWAAARIDDRAKTLVAAQLRVTASGGGFELLLATAIGLAAMLALGLAHGVSLPLAALAALAAAMTIDGLGSHVRSRQRRGHLREAEARLDAVLAAAGSLPTASPVPVPPEIGFPDLAVTLPPGTLAGIIGPSGSGKTMLLERLLRLRTVEPGRITLAGADITTLDPAFVRSCFAAAPQDAALLAGTVRDNLLLARPGATEAEIWEALHDAALDERVKHLRRGLDTWLGEDGASLSGGERRRLSLARAFLRDAPWLVLDEPTEGLDRQTEAVVVARLQARLARRGQGLLMVSHRPAPLELCGIIFAPSGDYGSSSRRRSAIQA